MPPPPPADYPTDQEFRLIFPSEAMAVRQAVQTVIGALGSFHLGEGVLDGAESVLAEVLNNIAEHAYGDNPGRVEVRCRRTASGLAFVVLDDGAAMPGGVLPCGSYIPPDANALPEGGFGWFLIRAQTCELSYRREGGRNRLAFVLPIGKE